MQNEFSLNFQNSQHEQISRQLVESIMHEGSVKEAFKRYLGDGQEYEKNINFIQDLIHSKKFVKLSKNRKIQYFPSSPNPSTKSGMRCAAKRKEKK